MGMNDYIARPIRLIEITSMLKTEADPTPSKM
jgi:hypothetical protein